MSSAVFTFTTQVPEVTFRPAPGSYTGPQQVTLADTDTAAKIYYTTDGSTPTAASNIYTAPIAVTASATISAIAIDPSLQNSTVVSGIYTIQSTGCTINFPSGFSSTAGLTLNGSTVASDDTRMQLTNGGMNQAGSVFCSQPINIQAFTTDFEFQLSTPQGDGFTFTIQNNSPTPSVATPPDSVIRVFRIVWPSSSTSTTMRGKVPIRPASLRTGRCRLCLRWI